MGCKLFCAVRRCRNNPLNRGHIRHRARVPVRRPTMGTSEWPPGRPARRLHRPFWRSQRHHSLKWCLNFELAKPRKSSSDPSFGSRKCYCLENMVKVRGRAKSSRDKISDPCVQNVMCLKNMAKAEEDLWLSHLHVWTAVAWVTR